ncbi:hypothetical protein ACNOYE_28025 [Nannocystaceae bacterium ST9]
MRAPPSWPSILIALTILTVGCSVESYSRATANAEARTDAARSEAAIAAGLTPTELSLVGEGVDLGPVNQSAREVAAGLWQVERADGSRVIWVAEPSRAHFARDAQGVIWVLVNRRPTRYTRWLVAGCLHGGVPVAPPPPERYLVPAHERLGGLWAIDHGAWRTRARYTDPPKCSRLP